MSDAYILIDEVEALGVDNVRNQYGSVYDYLVSTGVGEAMASLVNAHFG